MEDIDRIINGIYSRGQLSGVDGKKPLLNDWKKELKHLINQACNQARIELIKELKGQSIDEGETIRFIPNSKAEFKRKIYVPIEALEAKEKELNNEL